MLSDNLRLRPYNLPRYDQHIVQLRLKVWIESDEIIRIIRYACVTWIPYVAYVAMLQTTLHRWLFFSFGGKRNPRD